MARCVVATHGEHTGTDIGILQHPHIDFDSYICLLLILTTGLCTSQQEKSHHQQRKQPPAGRHAGPVLVLVLL